MNTEDALRQQLLEMIHGLLSDEEQRELCARISSDPEVARTYAEVSIEADLMAKAARLDAPKIALPKRQVTRGAAPRSRSKAWLTWTVVLAACLLVLVTGGGYLLNRMQQRDVAADHLRLLVAAPPALAPGVEARVTVVTQSATGRPLPSDVTLNLYDKQDRQLMPVSMQNRRTGGNGFAEFTIPATLDVNGPVRLEVLAYNGKSHPHMSRRLDLQPNRHITQLAVDKPWYQPGETVYYRSLTLESFSLATKEELPLEFEILDPAGSPVAGSKSQGATQHGVGNGSFAIDGEAAGGQYTLVARSLEKPAAFPEQKKTFLVQRYRLPRLKKELEFTRDSYAPGDAVVADFSAVKAEGGPAAGAKLQITATVDGKNVYEKSEVASSDGTFQVRFTLPKGIDKGEAQLAIAVDDGGTRETSAKTIPINLGKVLVDFYPEGGDLVAGLPNRVYFAARDPAGEPVHIEGTVIDSKGREVAKVATQHEGRGVFTLGTAKEQSYTLKISKPANVQNSPKLPEINKVAPVVLSTYAGVFDAGAPLKFSIASTKQRMPLAITATCRGIVVGQTTHVTWDESQISPRMRELADLQAGGLAQVTLPISDAADGVIRLTVYDYSEKTPVPVAERLVYRRPARKLTVALAAPDAKLNPGQHAEVTLKVTDERGNGVPAILGVAVVDDALLSLAREGTKHQPATMPTHFRLGAEIDKPEELENVNFYLSGGAKASESLDLLLGTQGWRRFVTRRLDELKVAKGLESQQAREAVQRLVAMTGPLDPPVVSDNMAEIQPAYEADRYEYQTRQDARAKIIGGFVGFGGFLLVVVVFIIALRRMARPRQLWEPVAVVAIVGILIGLLIPAMQTARESARWANSRQADFGPQAGAPKMAVLVDEASAMAVPDEDGAQVVLGVNGERFDAVHGPRAEPIKLIKGAIVNRAIRGPLGREEKQLADEEFAGRRDARLEQGELFRAIRRGQAGGGDGGFFYDPAGRGGRTLADLRHAMRRAAIAGKDAEVVQLAKNLESQLEHYRFTVRQYAHQHAPSEAGVRTDFAETLYWNPLVIADSSGQATIRFDLSDAVTTLRVLADAHTSGGGAEGLGRLGSGGGSVTARIPFSIEPKLPLEVNAGDRIELPVALVNDTSAEMTVALKIEHDKLLGLESEASGGYNPRTIIGNDGLSTPPNHGTPLNVVLPANSRKREFFTLLVSPRKGDSKLRLSGTAGTLSDTVEKTVRVVLPGFPVSESYAGRLDGEHKLTVTLPKDWVPGSLTASVQCYPTTLADLQSGVESIFREPSGCFEQASTSNYPNVLTMNYLQEHQVADPALTRRARDLMKTGYARLTGYECKEKGYEWFGGDPGHEALTAYGLMQFRDMARVYDVDPAMVQRTADWLLKRRDGQGGFERNGRALDSFGSAPPDVTNAYIVWALTESGQKGIDKELEHAVHLGRTVDDPYVVALSAASALNYGQEQVGRELLKKLAGMQQADGHLLGTQGSITRSGGDSLKVETTALAALAWLKSPAFRPQADKAIDWIVKSRQGSGGFGSTQGTILALKALVENAKASQATVSGGALIVERDDAEIGRVKFGARERNAITVDDLADKLEPGKNELTLKLTGDNKMPYAVNVSYRTQTPVSHPDCPVRLTTKVERSKLSAGGTVGLLATLENKTDKGQPMTVAILGIPGGTRVRADQLEELKKHGTIDYFETRAREVICYWRSLAPNRKVDLRLDLVAEVPGHYTAPASRTYLYYTAEQKQWIEPVVIDIERE